VVAFRLEEGLSGAKVLTLSKMDPGDLQA